MTRLVRSICSVVESACCVLAPWSRSRVSATRWRGRSPSGPSRGLGAQPHAPRETVEQTRRPVRRLQLDDGTGRDLDGRAVEARAYEWLPCDSTTISAYPSGGPEVVSSRARKWAASMPLASPTSFEGLGCHSLRLPADLQAVVSLADDPSVLDLEDRVGIPPCRRPRNATRPFSPWRIPPPIAARTRTR